MKRRQLERVERRRPLVEMNLIAGGRANPLAKGRLSSAVRQWFDRSGRRGGSHPGTPPTTRSPRPR